MKEQVHSCDCRSGQVIFLTINLTVGCLLVIDVPDSLVGGTSIMGGRGGYTGTIAGVGIMMILNSLMTILHMAEAGKQVVQGLLIIVLLVVVYGRRRER